jgi:hypothetical protein
MASLTAMLCGCGRAQSALALRCAQVGLAESKNFFAVLASCPTRLRAAQQQAPVSPSLQPASFFAGCVRSNPWVGTAGGRGKLRSIGAAGTTGGAAPESASAVAALPANRAAGIGPAQGMAESPM